MNICILNNVTYLYSLTELDMHSNHITRCSMYVQLVENVFKRESHLKFGNLALHVERY